LNLDGPEPSRASGPVRSRASTKQSTIHPDDSVSNGGYRHYRPRESDARSRSRAPTNDRRQLPFDDHPSARPSDSGYTSASRYRESDTRGRSRAPANDRHQPSRSGYPPTMPGDFGYNSTSSTRRTASMARTHAHRPQTRSEAAPEVDQRHHSRSVMHPRARQDLRSTYTYQPAAPDHYSRRSRAPTPDSRTSYGQPAQEPIVLQTAAVQPLDAPPPVLCTPPPTTRLAQVLIVLQLAAVQALHVLRPARCTLPPTTR
jgi:hypothetical protein